MTAAKKVPSGNPFPAPIRVYAKVVISQEKTPEHALAAIGRHAVSNASTGERYDGFYEFESEGLVFEVTVSDARPVLPDFSGVPEQYREP